MVALHGTVALEGGGLVLAIDAKDVVSGRAAVHASEVATSSDVVAAAMRLCKVVAAGARRPTSDDVSAQSRLSTSVEAVHDRLVGKSLMGDGDYSAAFEHLKRAVAVDPHFAAAHATLGLVLYDLQFFSDAAREIETALKDAGQLGERRRLTVLGDYYGATGQYVESVSAYEQLSVWPGDVEAEISIAATALEAQDWPLGLGLARRAASDHPRVAFARSNFVIALLAAGAFDDAVREGEAVLKSSPCRLPGRSSTFRSVTCSWDEGSRPWKP